MDSCLEGFQNDDTPIPIPLYVHKIWDLIIPGHVHQNLDDSLGCFTIKFRKWSLEYQNFVPSPPKYSEKNPLIVSVAKCDLRLKIIVSQSNKVYLQGSNLNYVIIVPNTLGVLKFT